MNTITTENYFMAYSDYAIEVPGLLNHFTQADLKKEWTTIFDAGPEQDLTATYGVKSKRITGSLKSTIDSSFTTGWLTDDPSSWLVEKTADTAQTEVVCTIGNYSIYAPISPDSFSITFTDEPSTTITVGPNPILVTSTLLHTVSRDIGDACLIIVLSTDEDWTTITARIASNTFTS